MGGKGGARRHFKGWKLCAGGRSWNGKGGRESLEVGRERGTGLEVGRDGRRRSRLGRKNRYRERVG